MLWAPTQPAIHQHQVLALPVGLPASLTPCLSVRLSVLGCMVADNQEMDWYRRNRNGPPTPGTTRASSSSSSSPFWPEPPPQQQQSAGEGVGSDVDLEQARHR